MAEMMSNATLVCAVRVLVGVCLVTVIAEREAAGETAPAAGAAEPDEREAAGETAPAADEAEPDESELAARLFSPETRERYAAITAIAPRGDPAWIGPLLQVARSDPSPEIRGWALRALRQIGTADALLGVQTIRRRDPDSRVTALAAQLLAGTPFAEPAAQPGDDGGPGPGAGAPLSQTGGDAGAELHAAASPETLRLRLESARRVRSLSATGFTLAATGFACLMIGVPVTFLGGSDGAMEAGITLQALGTLMWLIDTPILLGASRRMEAITGRSNRLRRATMGLFVAGLLLTVLHLGTGFASEEMAIAMPIVNGVVCTTARIMSLVAGARTSRDARAYLEAQGGVGLRAATADR